MSSIKQILMQRDGLSAEEAEELIDDARDDMNYMLENGDIDGAYNVCQDHFGLEPDYLDELMF
jgi:hypothetical protein